MKKRILFCANSLCLGGIEKSLISLLKHLDKNKYNIDLVLESYSGELINELPSNINVIEYKVSNAKNIFIRKIKNLLNQIIWRINNTNKYDCSICYATYSYPANLLSRISSKNSVMFVHSDYTKLYNKEDFKKFIDARNFDKFKSIVFVSNESKENFLKIYPDFVNNAKVINNIIDINKILEFSKVKPKVKFNKNNINLLFVGRLEEESKNIMTQLELINKLKEELLNIKLYILGDGPDKNIYEKYIKDNNLFEYIELLGQDTNPYPYIKSCDYILLTSNYEGYPVIFNEAIVLKKDIISTIKISDDYTDIGNNFGFLINKNNIYEEIIKIIKNKKTRKINLNINKINNDRIKKIEELINEK